MKTNEELQGMTHDELVAYAEELQTDLKSSRSSLTFYCEEKNKLEKYNPQIEMFARFKMKSSFHKTKRII